MAARPAARLQLPPCPGHPMPRATQPGLTSPAPPPRASSSSKHQAPLPQPEHGRGADTSAPSQPATGATAGALPRVLGRRAAGGRGRGAGGKGEGSPGSGAPPGPERGEVATRTVAPSPLRAGAGPSVLSAVHLSLSLSLV